MKQWIILKGGEEPPNLKLDFMDTYRIQKCEGYSQ